MKVVGNIDPGQTVVILTRLGGGQPGGGLVGAGGGSIMILFSFNLPVCRRGE